MEEMVVEKVMKDGHWRVANQCFTFDEVFGEGAEFDYFEKVCQKRLV